NVLFREQLQIEAYHLPGSLPQGQVGVESLHKTALATASLSNDIDKFSLLDLEVTVVQDHVLFLENGDILYIDNGIGHVLDLCTKDTKFKNIPHYCTGILHFFEGPTYFGLTFDVM